MVNHSGKADMKHDVLARTMKKAGRTLCFFDSIGTCKEGRSCSFSLSSDGIHHEWLSKKLQETSGIVKCCQIGGTTKYGFTIDTEMSIE